MKNLLAKELTNMTTRSLRRKAMRFEDLLGFVTEESILIEDVGIGLCTLEEYREDCFENETVEYVFEEKDLWKSINKLCDSTDELDLYRNFKNCKYCLKENLLLVELTNNKKICLLRL